jgi:hypothetical protein
MQRLIVVALASLIGTLAAGQALTPLAAPVS